MFSRMCVGRSVLNLTQTLKAPVPQRFVPKNYVIRNYAQEPRSRLTLWQRMMAPAKPKAFSLGKGALAGASAVGMAALCYYGLGAKSGSLQYADLWPQYVTDRIKSTYAYAAASLVLTAGSATIVYRTPALLNLVGRSSWIARIITLGIAIGSSLTVTSLPYKPGSGDKHLAWIAHTGIMGAVAVATLGMVGGPVFIRAAWYTVGVVGCLSTIAVCAPMCEFLRMRAPLQVGFGAVFAAYLASIILPPASVLSAGLYSLSFYGSLLVCSGILLQETQDIINHAELHPQNDNEPYDPIESAVIMSLLVLNIAMRIAMMLS